MGFDHFIQIWTQYRIEQAQWCNDYHRGSKRIGRRPCRPITARMISAKVIPSRPYGVTITPSVRYALASGPAAMASISHRTPLGRVFTATQLRAGLETKNLA